MVAKVEYSERVAYKISVKSNCCYPKCESKHHFLVEKVSADLAVIAVADIPDRPVLSKGVYIVLRSPQPRCDC